MKKLILLVIPAVMLWGHHTNAQTALNLDGVDNYVDCGENFFLTSYTKEAWINWRGVSNQNNIVSGTLSDNNHAFWAPNGNVRAGHGSPFGTVIDQTPLIPNEWVHVAVTYDGATGEMVLYRDGTEVARGFDDPGFVITHVLLGAFRVEPGTPGNLNIFGGRIDDVRIWNRVRTATEISDNINACFRGTEEGLMAFYDLEDGRGSAIASDVTGNGNDGVLVNFDVNNDWVAGVNCGEDQQNPTMVSLSPINDAYLQHGTNYNSSIVRVERHRRTGYLMFDTSNISGTIVEAKLKFTVTSDPGHGTLTINKGETSNWSETNLNDHNSPNSGALLASINDTFSLGSTKVIDLNGLNGFSGDRLSLVLNMTSGNDFAFGSKENNHVAKAELVIKTVPTTTGPTPFNLGPINDAYLEYGSHYNSNIVRVEKDRRTGYLMFDTSGITGDIIEAKLKFTVTSDPGHGTLTINKGNSNNWSENHLSNYNRPSSGALVASINDTFSLGSTKTIDLNGLSVSGDRLSLVLNMTSGNDFAFASKENSGVAAAELIIVTAPSSSLRTSSSKVVSKSIDLAPNAVNESVEEVPVSFRLFPNPTTNMINVQLGTDLNKTETKVEIIDGLGRIMLTQPVRDNKASINVSRLNSGLYYMRLTTKGADDVISKTFIKN